MVPTSGGRNPLKAYVGSCSVGDVPLLLTGYHPEPCSAVALHSTARQDSGNVILIYAATVSAFSNLLISSSIF